MYLPQKDLFEEKQSNHIIEKGWHNFYKPFMRKCSIWHAPFQTGRIIPDKTKDKDVKVVLTIHDLNALHEGKPVEEQIKSIKRTQALIDRCDAIVCISNFTREDVLKNCDVGNKPIYVIHNGTHEMDPPYLDPHSYKPARPFLFGMGYVNKKKNYKVLLPLLVSNPDMELVVAGRLDEADYVAAMKQEAIKLGVQDRLKLLGPVTEHEKSWYLENCTAFVHPSLAEGFGAPVVEAMMFGKPLFLSNLTSLPEVGGNVSFYFSSFDAEHMQQVFKEGMKKYHEEKMWDAIKKRSQTFDWKNSAEQYLEVYKSLY